MRTDRSRTLVRVVAFVALAALTVGCSTSNPTSATTTGPSPEPSALASAEETEQASPSVSAPTQQATASPAPTPTPTPPPSAPPTTPKIKAVTLSSTASDGSWKVTTKTPVVSGTAKQADINSKITSTISGYVAAFKKGAPAMMDNMPSTLDIGYTVAYASPRLLSLRLTRTEFDSGAVHPVDFVTTLNFDLLTGKVLAFADIFTNVSSGLGILSTQSKQQLTAKLGVDFIPAGADPIASNFAAWALTKNGMEITFPEYAVAPYAAGLIVVVVPWPALHPVVKPNSAIAELT